MSRHTQIGRNWDATLNEGAGDSLTLAHFIWMDLLGPNLTENIRVPGYSAYSAADGVYLTGSIHEWWTSSGYFELEVSESNHAIRAGHWNLVFGNTDIYTPTVAYDDSPGEDGFGEWAVVDSALWKYQNPFSGVFMRISPNHFDP